MKELSPSARQLLRAGAKAARPGEADRERVFEALRTQLGDAAMGGASGASAATSASHVAWLKLSGVAAFGLLAAGVVIELRSEPQLTEPAEVRQLPERATAVTTVISPAAIPTIVAPAPSAESGARLQPLGPSRAEPRRARDRLAQEVALLSRATSALRLQKPAEALKALSEHQNRFPKGILAEERQAARAQALCALGRRDEAAADLARLGRTAPQSPQTARARQACSDSR